MNTANCQVHFDEIFRIISYASAETCARQRVAAFEGAPDEARCQMSMYEPAYGTHRMPHHVSA